MSYVEDVKKLLRSTEASMSDIADRYSISPRTVQNINSGKTYHEADCQYPLRVTGRMIGNLRDRLSKADKNAVQYPGILSPQLIDYIGFLSLLGSGSECILEFKDVYYKQLVKIFDRQVSDQEILSIIELRPQRPTPLRELVDAYNHPKVRLLNTEYWIKTKLITSREADMIYSLLSKR